MTLPPLFPSSPVALGLGTRSKSLTLVQWKTLCIFPPPASVWTIRDTSSSNTSEGKGGGTSGRDRVEELCSGTSPRQSPKQAEGSR